MNFDILIDATLTVLLIAFAVLTFFWFILPIACSVCTRVIMLSKHRTEKELEKEN